MPPHAGAEAGLDDPFGRTWAWNATTSTEEVLAATNTIHRGEVITADDIQRIRISGDSALGPLAASAYDEMIGQRAALDISAGGLITTASTTTRTSMCP